MKDRGSTCKFRNARSVFREFTRESSVFHNTLRKKNSRIQSLYSHFIKLSDFGYEISILVHKRVVFRTGARSYVTETVPSNMNVNFFLIFIVTETLEV